MMSLGAYITCPFNTVGQADSLKGINMTEYKKYGQKALAALMLVSLTAVTAEARPASRFIDQITCPAGDEKFVMTLGVDDQFAGGLEVVRPRLEIEQHPTIQNFQTTHSHSDLKQYDENQANSYFADSFRDIPRPISEGYFITAFQNIGGNDALILGKGDKNWTTTPSQRHIYGVRISQAASNGWTVAGNYHSADLSTLPLVSGAGNLLDYINGDVSGSSAREFDVIMQDDTAIDFATLVLCRRTH